MVMCFQLSCMNHDSSCSLFEGWNCSVAIKHSCIIHLGYGFQLFFYFTPNSSKVSKKTCFCDRNIVRVHGLKTCKLPCFSSSESNLHLGADSQQ